MSAGRQFELHDLTLPAQERRRHRKDYAPPERISLSIPLSAAPASVQSPSSPHLVSEASTSTRSSRRSHDSDLVEQQLRHALYGEGQLSTSVSTNSSLASSAKLALPQQCVVMEPTKEALFRACLSGQTVDVDELRRLVWAHGVPDVVWIRPMTWKLLIEYLPPDRASWDRILAGKRAKYWARVAQVSVDPTNAPLKEGDHPLSEEENSEWREYFEDLNLRTVIRKDVDRTYPDLHRMESARDCLERILFLYAKETREIGYRQGLNELAAPFLLVFMEERGLEVSDAEADAYFCFELVMKEMKTCYLQHGMETQLSEFKALFRIKDPDLERHFEDLKVETRFFALRWIRIWLMREFELPDCLSLWDSFLTAEQRLAWVKYVCVAMLIRVREALLAADFVDCMKVLLHYPPSDVAEILRTADRLRTSNVVIVRKEKR